MSETSETRRRARQQDKQGRKTSETARPARLQDSEMSETAR